MALYWRFIDAEEVPALGDRQLHLLRGGHALLPPTGTQSPGSGNSSCSQLFEASPHATPSGRAVAPPEPACSMADANTLTQDLERLLGEQEAAEQPLTPGGRPVAKRPRINADSPSAGARRTVPAQLDRPA